MASVTSCHCSVSRAARPTSKRRLVPCLAQFQESEADVLCVGAGAAGLTSAYFAAISGAKVKVLEKMDEAGKKILISGGTRCNVLPAEVDLHRDYITDSSQSALRAVFSTWSLDDCEYWLSDPRQIGIRLALEQSTKKWFPASNSAAEVRDKLLAACIRHGVQVQYSAGLQDLQRHPDGSWRLELSDGSSMTAGCVILATGGLSFPKLGTTGDGYCILRKLGHNLHEPYPALTPLLGGHPGGQQLAGISLYEAQLATVPAADSADSGGGGKKKRSKAKRFAQRTAMLFTHRGYSGPAVMDLSHHAVQALERQHKAPQILVQWTRHGAADWEAKVLEGGSLLAVNLLRREGVPQRLAEALCSEAGVPLDRKLAELRKGERSALLEVLTQYVLPISGSEGYAKAEVTGGGVPLNELNVGSMESRLLPGLYVCGELCDVFGRIGGYNYLWAFVSARLAGLSAAEASAGAGQLMPTT